MSKRRVIVIGGGIVGLATAYKLMALRKAESVQVLEKEPDVGRHQSTHNSGVLHAGLYYAPGSMKARLARAGLQEMVAFCREYGIAHEMCGKLVVATEESELERLRSLLSRGTENGLRGLRMLSRAEMLEREPNVAGVAGVLVPEEGIVDYAAVCRKLRELIVERGGEIHLESPALAIAKYQGGWRVESARCSYDAHTIVNCAGLQADRVARLAGETPEVRIVPFRGEYWKLTSDASHLVRHLIYPVPDPAFPFLGVHLTRLISGGVEAGPNAVLALAREGYNWRSVRLRDIADSIGFSGLWRFLGRYPGVAAYEVARSLSKRLFLRSLQRLVPGLRSQQLVRGITGVRAQVMARDGSLVQDFVIARAPGAVHVISAPSPGATSSLAIGGEIARMAFESAA